MDRILDSGSNDWGSTPHGDTKSRPVIVVNCLTALNQFARSGVFSFFPNGGEAG